MDIYIESFLPLFVAMNLPGVLPMFIGLTEGMSATDRRRLVLQATATAFVVAILILFAGQVIFEALGITVNDLRVGGIVLLVLAINDLIFSDMRRRSPAKGDTTLGIVPLGIPLTIGPAAITTILVSQQSFGYLPTLSSLLLNLTLVGVGYLVGPPLIERFGSSPAKAVSKIASLFLAAIAVAMIRAGVVGFVTAL